MTPVISLFWHFFVLLLLLVLVLVLSNAVLVLLLVLVQRGARAPAPVPAQQRGAPAPVPAQQRGARARARARAQQRGARAPARARNRRQQCTRQRFRDTIDREHGDHGRIDIPSLLPQFEHEHEHDKYRLNGITKGNRKRGTLYFIYWVGDESQSRPRYEVDRVTRCGWKME